MTSRLGGPERIAVLLLLLAGAAVRLPQLADPPFAVAPTRQHYNALMARALLLRMQPDAPPWRREVVEGYIGYTTRPEPPIVESIAAGAFLLAGQEELALPRAFSILYWLAGSLFLYLLARRLTSASGAMLSLLTALFLPWAIGASTSFQPDPLAIAFMCAALYALDRYDDSGRGLSAAALLTAGAILVRFMTGFFLFVVAASLIARRHGWRGLLQPSVLLGAALAIAPALTYYLYALASQPSLRERASTTFVPGLLATSTFWSGWANMVSATITIPFFIVGIVGAITWRRRQGGLLLASLWVGYVVYSVLFTLHTYTHTYYQTLGVPIVALSLAGFGPLLIDRLPVTARTIVLGLAAAAAVFFGYRSAPDPPADMPTRLGAYRSAGAAAEHSAQAIFLTDYWSLPLRYYGEVSGRYWPTRFEVDMYRPLGEAGIPDIPAEARLAQLSSEIGGARFFVVTDFGELARQPDLSALLERYRIVDHQPNRFAVYSLTAEK